MNTLGLTSQGRTPVSEDVAYFLCCASCSVSGICSYPGNGSRTGHRPSRRLAYESRHNEPAACEGNSSSPLSPYYICCTNNGPAALQSISNRPRSLHSVSSTPESHFCSAVDSQCQK